MSEALYISDPDDNGLELYRDRPRSEWRWTNGAVEMATDPVDISGAKGDVIRTVTIRPPAGVEVGQRTSQVHVFISPAPGVSPSPAP